MREGGTMRQQQEGQDADLADDLPGIYVDSYTLFWWSDRLRIIFGEYLNQRARYRTAIVMPLEDAELLARDLLEAVEKARKLEAS